MPKVSFVVPVYNVMQYLEQCVESLLEQTERDIEIILVDDGSIDGSGAFCDDCAAKDSRVTVIHQQNAGPSKARNAGIEAARSEWISFVDSDDWISPEAVKEVEPYLLPENDLVVFSYCRTIDKKDSFVFKESENVIFSSPESRDLLAGACFLNQEYFSSFFPKPMAEGPVLTIPFCKLYRKSILDENCIRFNEAVSYSEDKLFNYEYLCVLKGSVFFINRPHYHYRTREGSIVRSSVVDLCERYDYMMKAFSKIAECGFPGPFSEKCFSINIVNNMITIIHRGIKNGIAAFFAVLPSINSLLRYPIVRSSIKSVRVRDFNGVLRKLVVLLLKI